MSRSLPKETPQRLRTRGLGAHLSLSWSRAFDDATAEPFGKRVPQLQKLDLLQCMSLGDAVAGRRVAVGSPGRSAAARVSSAVS